MKSSKKNADLSCRFPNKDDLSQEAIQHLCDLINRVYDDAESGMWKIRGSRTTLTQVKYLLEQKALILAEIDRKLVGSVNINLMEGGTGEFGMLVADPDFRGMGIGSALVKAAEEWAISKKCKTMRLELLTPRGWRHPSKEFLKKWYRRIGYVPQFTEPFEKLHPEKVPELATDCDFTVWLKNLST